MVSNHSPCVLIPSPELFASHGGLSELVKAVDKGTLASPCPGVGAEDAGGGFQLMLYDNKRSYFLQNG